MKTKIKRHSRSVLSVILAISMLLSTMMVGLIATDAAQVTDSVGASYDGESVGALNPGTVFYDNTDTQWAHVYCYVGKSDWTSCFEMIQTGTNPNVYYFKTASTDHWTSATHVVFSGTAVTDSNGAYKNIENIHTDIENAGGTCTSPEGTGDTDKKIITLVNGNTSKKSTYVIVGDTSPICASGSNTWDFASLTNSTFMNFDGSKSRITFNNVAAGTYTFSLIQYNKNWESARRWNNKGTLTDNGLGSWANGNDGNIALTITDTANVTIEYGSVVDITLNSPETRYAVTLATDGHGTVTPNSKQVGATAQSLPAPVPADGYVFSRWTTNSSDITITNPTDPDNATVSARGAGTVTANFVPNTNMKLYIAGRFRYRASAGADFTTTFTSGDWNADSTRIPFVYSGSGTVYKVDTYSSVGELSAQLVNLDPFFFVYDTTDSSDKKHYYANSPSVISLTNTYDNTTKVDLSSTDSTNNAKLKFGETSSTAKPVTIFYDTNTHELWYKTVDPNNEGLYSLSGNVTDKYIVGSEIVKPKNIDTSLWWSTFHDDLAIDEVVGSAGSGTFKIVFTTTEYAGGINIGLAGKDGFQYAFNYNGTAYNSNGADLDLTTPAMQTAGRIENVYVYNINSSNPGGSLKLQPNTTYTITIDQTARLDDSTDNPLGKMTIDWNTVYAKAVAMTAAFDKNTRRYNTPEESTTGGTASPSFASGNKGELDPTFTASANTGYTFAGWYSDPECTDLVSSNASYAETDITVEHTYYALFKQNKPSTERTVTVTVTGSDYGSIAPGPGLEYVSINESGANPVITFKAYDGATTYITATPKEATSSAAYELGTVTFTAGTGSENNGKITLPNITQDTALTVPFTTRSTYTVTLKGTHGKISAQAKNADDTDYTGTGNSVSNVTSGSVNVPIGGTVTLTAGTADSYYTFSKFELEAGKYKRASNQSATTSPMTIRPLQDMTAEAVFVNSNSGWTLDFDTDSFDTNMTANEGLIVKDFNTDSSATVYTATITVNDNKSDHLFVVKNGNDTYKFDQNPQVLDGNGAQYGGTGKSNKASLKPSSLPTTYTIYVMKNPDNAAEIKIMAKTGESGNTIDTSAYRKIYAMDGVETGTASFGETVILNPNGLVESDVENAQGKSEAYVEPHTNYNVYFYAPNREEDITFRVQTTVSNHGSGQANQYLGVRGFVYNGKSVLATDDGNGVYYADITVNAKDIVDINGRNTVKNSGLYPILEIVPVYYNTKLDDDNDCIKFYVDANSMQNKFGFNLGYYAWYTNGSNPDGTEVQMTYPGQPLLKEGTKYYTYLPKKYTANNDDELGKTKNNDLAGVLLDNLWENCTAHKEVLKSWACVSTDANYQTFDYEDPIRIKELNADTIEFVVKYEETNSDHRNGTHWYEDTTYNKGTTFKGYSTSHTIPITMPAGKTRLNGFEQLRDYDNDPVDVYGTKLTSAQNNFDNAVFIVSVGNQTVAPANDWDTVWMIYDHSGNFVEASNPKEYIQKATKNNDLTGVPAYINYEKFLDGSEKTQVYGDNKGKTGNSGDRIDGRWLYTTSSLQSTARIRVATLGKNGDTLNFMTYANGASGARIAYEDDSCDGITQNDASTQEDLFGRKTEFPDRKTKAKAVLNQPNGYKIVGFYMQKVGVLGDEDDNYFSNSKADYDEMNRESATVAKFTNARNNYIVAIVEKVPSSNLHITHEMYGGTGAHYGAGQFYVKAEVLAPESNGTRTVIASSNGFVNGNDGYEFEYLNGIARKVDNESESAHYMVRVTIRTVMAGTNTLYQWYNKNLETGGYDAISDNDPASYGKNGTQDKIIEVDVNDLYDDNEDTFKYTNLDYYSDIDMGGAVHVTHSLKDGSVGSGTTYASVRVLNDGTEVATFNTDYSATGTITVPSQYTKKSSGNTIEITLRTVPDEYSTFNKFWESDGTTEITGATTDANRIATKTLTEFSVETLYNNVGTQEDPQWEFDTSKSNYQYYSDLTKADIRYEITYNYHSALWNNQGYKVSGTFTVAELASLNAERTDFTDNTAMAAFLYSKAPYEDNFRQELKWNATAATVTKSENTLNISVSTTPTENNNIRLTFHVPFAATWKDKNGNTIAETESDNVPREEGTEFVPTTDENGKVWYTTTNPYSKSNIVLTYMTYPRYSINGEFETKDIAQEKYVQAPKSIWKTVNDTPTEVFFSYWELQDQNSGKVYAKNYSQNLNTAFYCDTVATAVYENATEEAFNSRVPKTEDVTASISLMEQSRNQWNSDLKGTNTKWTEADRLISDYLLAFSYNGKTLKAQNNMYFGVLYEAVGELEAKEGGGYYTNADHYTGWNTVTTDIENAAKSYINNPTTGNATYMRSQQGTAALDNKNQIQYTYTIKNGDTELRREYKYYRVYAYLIDSNGNITLSAPIFQTIYDIASIQNGSAEMKPVSN